MCIRDSTHCVNAYAYKLRSLSDYIQQIEMESNGKSVNNNNHKVSYNTAPFLFGQEGTECQHSFFQMVHQGSLKMSADFIGIINSNNSESSNFLLANLIAQSNLLYSGKENNHSNMNINGNCPSNNSVVIPSTYTSITDYTFLHCSNLQTVIFEATSQVTSIGAYAFGHTNLTTISIPSSVISINCTACLLYTSDAADE